MTTTWNSWNPSDKNANITLSGGDLTGASSGFTAKLARSVLSKSDEWLYWEVICDSGATAHAIGLADASASLSAVLGIDTHGWAYLSADGKIRYNNIEQAYGDAYGAGDIIGIAVRVSSTGTGYVWFRLNGVWQNSGDPEAGTGYAFALASGTTIYAAFSHYGNSYQTTLVPGPSLNYSVPAGYMAGFKNQVNCDGAAVLTLEAAGESWGHHNGAAVLDYLVAEGSIFKWVANGAAVLDGLSASGTMGSKGAAVLSGLEASGTLKTGGVSRGAAVCPMPEAAGEAGSDGVATLSGLSAAGNMLVGTISRGAAVLPGFSAAGTMRRPAQIDGAATLRLSAAGHLQHGAVCRGAAVLSKLLAAGTLKSGGLCRGAATLSRIDAAGTAYQQIHAAGAATLSKLLAAGTAHRRGRFDDTVLRYERPA